MTEEEAGGRESGPKGRRRRWDAGPWLTPRDADALVWLAEQFGAREDVAGVLLSMLTGRVQETGEEAGPGAGRRVLVPLSGWRIRDTIDRWVRAGWVERVKVFRRTWLVPTEAGLAIAAERAEMPKPFAVWRPSLSRAAHTHAVNVVRLAYELGGAEAGPWLSERALNRKFTHASSRAPDGIAVMPPSPESPKGRRVLFEVELTIKAQSRYDAILATAAEPGTDKALWLTWPDKTEQLERRLEKAAGAARGKVKEDLIMRYEVKPLPEIPGVTYEQAL
jgi:hypothetical protein